MQLCMFIIACLAILLILRLGRTLILWDELRKLKKSGYRKASFPRPVDRH